MSFIRAKEIPPHSGNWYDYEVETIHEGAKVRQRVIRYIGRSERGAIASGIHSISSEPKIHSDTLTLIKPASPKVACKYCQSQNTSKYGLYKGIQNYFCKDCKTKFTGTDALSHGRVSPSYIANALNEYGDR